MCLFKLIIKQPNSPVNLMGTYILALQLGALLWGQKQECVQQTCLRLIWETLIQNNSISF